MLTVAPANQPLISNREATNDSLRRVDWWLLSGWILAMASANSWATGRRIVAGFHQAAATKTID